MKVAVIGKGLIGGSFEKASLRAGHEVVILHHGDETGFESADIVVVCLPPEAIAPWVKRHAAAFKPGAMVVDIAGVKRQVMSEMKDVPRGDWTFVGGHPMAGREVSGYENSLPTLFDGASMILVPEDDRSVPEGLDAYFRTLGFARVVVTTAERHDAMIAFTSQLCHVIATAYSRDPLVEETTGFTAGSYRDMTRIATQDPKIWGALYDQNREALLRTVDAFIGRMTEFREALASKRQDTVERLIAEGADAKRRELGRT